MIQLHELRKRYPGVAKPTLAAVSFSLEPGEFAFLCGPSGSGKTTLLRILVGMEPVSGGQVLVRGRNLASISGARLAELRRRIGFVFQDFRLLHDRTAVENVEFPLQVRGLPASEARRRATVELDRVGMADQAQSLPATLSGGEQQRVAIARALVGEPALLLADEPTGNLDPDLGVRVMELFVDAQVRGTAVLVATHDPTLLSHFRRRVLRLEGGRIAEDTALGHLAAAPASARA